MNIRIQKYAKQYYDQTLQLFKSYPKLFPKSEIKIVLNDLSTNSSENHVKFIATNEEDEVVGYSAMTTCYSTDFSWQIQWLVVHPKFQSKGIGSQLIDEVFQHSIKLNLSQLYVETCSCKGEKPARRFYEKHGFNKIATLPNFYNSGHSKVIYLRSLEKR